MYDVIRESDMSLLLISDAAFAENYKKIFAAFRPGATLGLSHGFLLSHLKAEGETSPGHQCHRRLPEGHGPIGAAALRAGPRGRTAPASMRASPCSRTSPARRPITRSAGRWRWLAVTFQTTLESEYRSDIFGERGILLGAVHGIAESLYARYVGQGMAKDDAYLNTSKSITGPISKTISRYGLRPSTSSRRQEKAAFRKAFNAAYHPRARSSRRSTTTSPRATRCAASSRPRVATAPTRWARSTAPTCGWWARRCAPTASELCADQSETAGVYLACMMAQVDLLKDRGHPYSEIANESIIEAVDSLNPYMDHKGVSYMVDNCSTTARLGARKWAARFDYILKQQAFTPSTRTR